MRMKAIQVRLVVRRAHYRGTAVNLLFTLRQTLRPRHPKIILR